MAEGLILLLEVFLHTLGYLMAAISNPAALGTKFLIGPTKAALIHGEHLSNEWTPDEVAVVEELLVKYAAESEMYRYAQIAMQLKDKCLRDVILRCRWMSKNGKRGKYHISREDKEKKQKLTDSMPKLTHARAIMPMDSDGGISYQAIGGPAGQLLEQNAKALDQISANFDAFKIQENINLLFQARNNILTVVKNLNDTSEMSELPPLPVKLNEELVNSILQRPPSFPDKS